MTIHRSKIIRAQYNPKSIDAHAAKRLKESIKKNTLVDPLVWNKRNGVLVGGHQRLDALDALEGTLDYHLTVSAIDVDEKKEKEINVTLSNVALMGSFDQAALAALLESTPDLDLSAMAMTQADFISLVPNAGASPVHKMDAEEIAKNKEMRAKRRQEFKDKDDAGYFVVVVFGTRASCDEFLREHHLPLEEQYIDGDLFAEKVR